MVDFIILISDLFRISLQEAIEVFFFCSLFIKGEIDANQKEN